MSTTDLTQGSTPGTVRDMNETPNPTKLALAKALTESTGRHMLDSGGAYGRQWERNQAEVAKATGKPLAELSDAELVAYFDGRPEVTVQEWGPMLDVYHFLAERLELDPALDAAFAHYCETDEEAKLDSWLGNAQSWPESIGVEARTFYSYNDENLLSQDVHWTEFTDDRGDYGSEKVVILSIHGGCDARGGFTRPRVFRTSDSWYYDCVNYYADCPGRAKPQEEVLFVHEDGYYDPHQFMADDGEHDLGETWDDDAKIHRCPICGNELSFYAPSYDY